MKIYTKTGDAGETGLLGGSRVSKTALRIQAIGDVDELNAAIGMARAARDDALLEEIQCRLFDLGAELATPPGVKAPCQGPGANDVNALEASIDQITESLPPLKNFILPGGSEASARLHLARAVCRRAERTLLELHEIEPVRGESRVYLNRLSDWLFVAARRANSLSGVADVPWQRAKGDSV